MLRVSAVALYNEKGRLLMGLRRDSGKWCCPGGKLERGEDPLKGAYRELLEEAGVEPDGDLELLGSEKVKNGSIEVFAYRGTVKSDVVPTNENDPDAEYVFLRWIDVTNGLPENISDKLHNSKDVVLGFLGLQRLDKHEIDSIESWVASQQEGEPMQKGLKRVVAGGLAGAAMLAGAGQAIPGNAFASQHPIEMAAPVVEPPPAPTVAAPPKPSKTKPWTPEGLHMGLYPIAHLESNWGRNVNHEPSKRGDFYTAYGALGLKPSTAFQQYRQSKAMQATFPDLGDTNTFLQKFRSDSRFYNAIATSHWQTLRHMFNNDTSRAAYGWRWGPAVAQGATPEEIEADPYIQKYHELWSKLGLDKHTGIKTAMLDKAEVTVPRSRPWKSRDGISIPASGTPQRTAYDAAFNRALEDHFSSGTGMILRRVRVPIKQLAPMNSVVNKDRYQLYSKMAGTPGERLPPIVIRQSGDVFDVLDGNHRAAAAQAKGHTHLDAMELVNPPLRKAHAPLLSDKRFASRYYVRSEQDERGPNVTPHEQEANEHPPELKPIVEHYHKLIHQDPEVHAPNPEYLGGVSPKTIFDLPHPDGVSRVGRYIVKPYHEFIASERPIHGWAEMTNQSLFHAGGIGHLHQKVFVTHHDLGGGETMPSLVIAADPHVKQPMHDIGPYLRQHPEHIKNLDNDAAKVLWMDFLGENYDRHTNNMLWGAPEGTPKFLAIDHGRNFQYKTDMLNLDTMLSQSAAWENHFRPEGHEAMQHAAGWWQQFSPQIRAEMDRRLNLINDPKTREFVDKNFKNRAEVLDKVATNVLKGPWDENDTETHPLLMQAKQFID